MGISGNSPALCLSDEGGLFAFLPKKNFVGFLALQPPSLPAASTLSFV